MSKYPIVLFSTVCLLLSCSDENAQTTQTQQDTPSDSATTQPDASDSTSLCGNGTIDDGEACDDGPQNSDTLADACRTNCQRASCGDGVVDLRLNETCDDANTLNDDGCNNLCRSSSCGDGVLQPDETCDDGPNNSDARPDACRLNCTPARCGDAFTDTDEDCDDGNDLSNDACIACVSARCGDGLIRQNIETCDDQNNASLDGCSDLCRVEFGFTCQGEPSTCTSTCGDGMISSLEACDDANTNDNDYCAPDCSATTGRCGDNITQSNEVCDDGNTQNGDECAANCQAQLGACGDNITQSNETCDDGNTTGDDYCAPDCQSITGFCGDDSRQQNETCDDGNTTSGDYCSANCAQVTGQCGDGSLQNNEVCDDNNLNTDDYCSQDCQVITGRCGDSIIQSIEDCDDGNTQNGDSCNASCSGGSGGCGDGVLNPSEVCDDGNNLSNDYCSGDCQTQTGFCGDGLRQTQEACDDANNLPNDYCSPNCLQITGMCGDFFRQDNETCEDRNTTDQDGCSSLCQVEFGFQCTTAIPNVCQDTCGDGLTSANEPCDDANTTPGDGCNAICQPEFAYSCTGNAPSLCTSTCGDNQKAPDEPCDDGNPNDNDGCSSTCQIEFAYACTGATASTCTSTCGDSLVASDELCDDANTQNGDGCDTSCNQEPGWRCDNTTPPSVCTLIPPATVLSVDYPVIAHGGQLILSGNGFTDTVSVTIGAVPQPFVADSDTQITITAVANNTPLDTQPISISTTALTGTPFDVVVVHLAISEMNIVGGNTGLDRYEFIEVHTGLPRAITLSGYRVVQISGASATPAALNIGTHAGIDLGSTPTADTGYFLMAPSQPGYTTQVTFSNNSLEHDNGDAVAIYQHPDPIPNGTSAAAISGNVIDAVIYNSSDSTPHADLTSLLNFFYGANITNPKRTFTDEGTNQNPFSISRCNASSSATPPYTSADLMDGRVFQRSILTPGADNWCQCGNGLIEGPESCDDANLTENDGCGACKVGFGYICTSSPSVCTSTCGDGKKASNEPCDDGDLTSGDGCSTTCQIESGYVCTGTNPSRCCPGSACPPNCGDGVANLFEDCDGADLKGETCASIGAGTGSGLSCTVSCDFDTSGCIAP